jgi:3-phosphoshikimate 1-carboxyvinyltransferase
MKVTIQPGKIAGCVYAIPSKSHFHRLLIFSALSDKETLLSCAETDAEDINATIGCLTALGASVERRDEGLLVTPLNRDRLPRKPGEEVLLPCMESGSTLRFMLPVVCALGLRGTFQMKGRLPQRPMAPLDVQLESHGIRLWRDKPDLLCCEGQLSPGEYHLPGDISSQYITGLLMALPLLDASSNLTVTEPIESADYIAMTLEAAKAFGQKPGINQKPGNIRYDIEGVGAFLSPGRLRVEGDWSNGAFWLCAGAMPGGDIQLQSLEKNSSQGDREVCGILTRMGALINWENATLHVKEGERRGIEIDVRATPDLGPVLAAVAAAGTGTTVIRNAARLRLKESDRLFSTAQTLTTLGADISETEDSLVIKGRPRLGGGLVDSFGDHRIAMMAAIASAACTEPVTITGAQAVNKSYPAFWKDLAALGKNLRVEE